MKKLLDLITEEMEQAFAKAGYDGKYARVTLSNRPDLCEYQCNGATFLRTAGKMNIEKQDTEPDENGRRSEIRNNL